MYWHEDTPERQPAVGHQVVDLVFRVECKTLPLDHAYALSKALLESLPWLSDEDRAGIHVIYGPGSQNGWHRPEETDDAILHLSRRARMTLRLPPERVEDARALTGAKLDIGGHSMTVRDATEKPLDGLPTLFARYVVAPQKEDEETFVRWVAEELSAMGIRVRKILCGKSHYLRTSTGRMFTRSVMVADLSKDESLRLQQQGLGTGRKLGCGLFVPHKGIAPVKKAGED